MESCNFKFSVKKERRSHCIEVHKFPPDFRYDSSKNEKRVKKVGVMDPSKITPKPPSSNMFGLKHGSNRGMFRNRGRGGFQSGNKKSWHTAENLEVSMADLEEALPSME